MRFAEDGDQMWQPVEKVLAWIEVCSCHKLHFNSYHDLYRVVYLGVAMATQASTCWPEADVIAQAWMKRRRISCEEGSPHLTCRCMRLCRQCMQRGWMRILRTRLGMQQKRMQRPLWQASAAAPRIGMRWTQRPSDHAPLNQVLTDTWLVLQALACGLLKEKVG